MLFPFRVIFGRMDLKRPLEIFIAEDCEADVRWLEDVLAGLQIPYNLWIARDGEEAFGLFCKRFHHASAPDPDIAFLDLNMPRRSGIEVLEQIEAVDKTPICILTTSPFEKDAIIKRFQIAGPRYIVKPLDDQKLLEALDCFESLRGVVAAARRRLAAGSNG